MRAIVNVAAGGRYPQGQERLSRSLDDIGEKAERIFFTSFPGETHVSVPYGFKIDAFREAERRGYEQILWMDSSCSVKRDLKDAWDQIERDGYLLGQEGWSVGQWCNEIVREKAGYTREQLLGMTLVEGKFIGLDLTHEKGRSFLHSWEKTRDEGWFNGSWSDHRHDITAAGIIAHELGLNLTPHLISLPRPHDPGPPEAFCFAQGMP